MKREIKINGKRLTQKDLLAMSNHPKTIAFFEIGKSLLNGSDLSVLDQNKKNIKEK